MPTEAQITCPHCSKTIPLTESLAAPLVAETRRAFEEKLFQKTARAFSSGCIRLKTPVQLAEWALSNANKWSVEDIEKAIGQGRTQTVKPEDDISVYFTYQTVWMGDDNLIHISDDPYRMDPKMVKVLNPGE